MYLRQFALPLVAIAAFSISACNFAVDTALLSMPDSGSECDDACLDDNSTRQDPSSTKTDPAAQTEPGPDENKTVAPDENKTVAPDENKTVAPDENKTVVPPVVPPTGPTTPSCTDDAGCSATSYCAPSAGECVPRCDATRGCRSQASRYGLVTDGALVFWSTVSGQDGAGNALHNGKVYSWDTKGSPTEVRGGDDATLLLAVDEDLYLTRAGSLFRLPKVGAVSAEELATGFVEPESRVWAAKDAVYWTRPVKQDHELWRRRRVTSAKPELVATAKNAAWLGGNETYLARGADLGGGSSGAPYTMSLIKLQDLSVVSTTEVRNSLGRSVTYSGRAVIDDKYVYFGDGNAIVRASLSNLEDRKSMTPGLMPSAIRFQVDGDWVYWYGYGAGPKLGRTHRDLMEGPTDILVSVQLGAWVVTKAGVFYGVDNESQPARTDQPSLSCSAETVCPATMSCANNLVCK